MKDLESGILEYMIVKEFLIDLKKEFSGKEDETIKVVKLKKVDQRSKTMKELVQEFRKVARRSRYKG